MTTSLELGCDCLGEIRYLDAVLHDSTGEPYTITNAICIHEEDDAVLWKHVDHDAGAEVRRMRRLTMSFHVTVANYEYLVYWRLYQDGNIECEVRATGIMVTTPLAAGRAEPERHAGRRAHVCAVPPTLPGRAARPGRRRRRQHRRSCRSPTPSRSGPDNPYGLSVVTRNVPLRTESEGKQDVDFATQRAWKVVNTNVTNGLGTHPSYKLVPGGAHPADVRSRVAGHASAPTSSVTRCG